MTVIRPLVIPVSPDHGLAAFRGVIPMTEPDQSGVEWRCGVPISTRFDDPYFSLNDGLAETAHVFHAGNGLPGRFRPGFHIAELGFGTGLNLLATVDLWQRTGQVGTLHFTSFEAFPLSADALGRALQPFEGLAHLARDLLRQWGTGDGVIRLPGVLATVIIGDAQQTLGPWAGRADAWFLDGFSPAKNPELWSDAILGQVARHTAQGGTFATYTAAGHVRRALQAAGFQVSRLAGHGSKRHMSAGVLMP